MNVLRAGLIRKEPRPLRQNVDLVVYFSCSEIILLVGIRQTLSPLTLLVIVALGGVRSTCLFVLGRQDESG